MKVSKELREWVEEMHLKIHSCLKEKKPDHKAGYYDWLAGLAVMKILKDTNANEESLIDMNNDIIELNNKIVDLEYKMDSFVEMAEEILSEKVEKKK